MMTFQPSDDALVDGEPILEDGNLQDRAPDVPGYVTEDRLLEVIVPIIEKEVQRRSDRFDDRVEKVIAKEVRERLAEFDQRLATARQAGLNISDAKAAQMRQEEEDRLAAEVLQGKIGREEPNPQSASPTRPEPEVEPDYEYEFKLQETLAKVARLHRDLGFKLTERDPEYRRVPWNEPDPDKFFTIFEREMKQKALRLGGRTAQAAAPAPQPQTRAPGAAAFSLGGGAPRQTLETIQAELDALQRKPGKSDADWQRMNELGKQLREALK